MKPERIIQHAHNVPGLGCKGTLHSHACQYVCAAIEAAVDEAAQHAAARIEKARNEAAQLARQAQAKGDQVVHLQANGASGMAEFLRRQILLPEGGCQACMNTREVQSTIAPGLMTRCPACAEGAA